MKKRINNLVIFIILNFAVSFIADIVLNDLTRKPLSSMHNYKIIHSLKSYFNELSIIQAGVYAGLTVSISLLVFMVLYNLLGLSKDNIMLFLVLAFWFGYIIDIVIEKMDVFGEGLREYYQVAGAGLWGGIAFIVSIIVSYFIQRNILVK